jgi:putative protease
VKNTGCGGRRRSDAPLGKESNRMSGTQIGEVTHYYNHLGVAVLALTEKIRLGDTVHVLGHSTDFRQQVTSLQLEHQPVEQGAPGQDIAMKVERRVHPHDQVFRIEPD